MNNKVTVTGMEVKTKVSSNLLIAETNSEANYLAGITQVSKGILEPASSTDAVAFWYTATSNVVANGDAKAEAYIKYGAESALAGDDATTYKDAFSKNYGISKTDANTLISGKDSAVPYVDYTFFLKATNTESADAEVSLTKCNLLYNTAAIGADEGKAFRVAMFVQDSAAETATAGVGTLVTILTLSGAKTFSNTGAGTDKAVNAADALGSVTYNTDAVVDNALVSGATKYYKVVVRMWLEGEDTTCTNETYAILSDAYTLDLEFSIGLDANVTAVTNIGSEAVAP